MNTSDVFNLTVGSYNQSAEGEKQLFVVDLSFVLSFIFGGFGAFLNFSILAVMMFKDIGIKSEGKILLENQLVLDGLAGCFLIIGQFRIPMDPNSPAQFAFVCVALERSMIVWIFYVTSAYNLVAIALQKFIMVVVPFRTLTLRQVYILVFCVYLQGFIVNVMNYGLEMEVVPSANHCLYRYTSFVATSLWLCLYYLIPTSLLIGFSTKSVITLRQKAKGAGAKKSEILLLKNSVVVAIIFVVFASFNNWAYFLLPLNVVHLSFYESFFRHFSYMCTVINSASTPMVYLFFLSSVRKQALAVIGWRPHQVAPSAGATDTTDTW